MPSHITHALFAEQVWLRVFGSHPPKHLSPWLVQGSGGPDFLFSGVRRQPSAEKWAHRLHHEGYGRVTAALAADVAAAHRKSEPPADAMEAYLYGFSTHAVLDRQVHPLVNYFSGWEDPEDPESDHLRFCHSFMERIIDMIILRDMKGLNVKDWNHARRRPAPETNGKLLTPLLANAITAAYPGETDIGELKIGITNAFQDDSDFFALFDPAVPGGGPAEAEAMEQRGDLPRRILALFYPEEIPPGDFLNEDGAGWLDPRSGGRKRRESFIDLYTAALNEASGVMQKVRNLVRDGVSPTGLSESLGNGDLNDPTEATGENPLRYCEPMDISPLIDKMYENLE